MTILFQDQTQVKPKVAMIGVGKLGQDCAEVMASHYDVVGYDIVPRSPTFPMCQTIKAPKEGRRPCRPEGLRRYDADPRFEGHERKNAPDRQREPTPHRGRRGRGRQARAPCREAAAVVAGTFRPVPRRWTCG